MISIDDTAAKSCIVILVLWFRVKYFNLVNNSCRVVCFLGKNLISQNRWMKTNVPASMGISKSTASNKKIPSRYQNCFPRSNAVPYPDDPIISSFVHFQMKSKSCCFHDTLRGDVSKRNLLFRCNAPFHDNFLLETKIEVRWECTSKRQKMAK